MLVLKRKAGESVLIGEAVRVIVISVDRGEVELAIEAPKEVVITREQKEAPNGRSHARRA